MSCLVLEGSTDHGIVLFWPKTLESILENLSSLALATVLFPLTIKTELVLVFPLGLKQPGVEASLVAMGIVNHCAVKPFLCDLRRNLRCMHQITLATPQTLCCLRLLETLCYVNPTVH